ncbi:anti-sigma factor antagonist [Micromonospora sp. WMMD1102]|uniref:STAS domain-containing protein n=1 Tax=Micromonospora sp. WMMD1102 TaxID=3016105 RepID=UPI00241504C0|nr:anti-sigma factor antagonist [Micromonospora sp. WMMD1102]MDG4787829.1 anti-sigma factor antagonist [Micromonospora sp. WMMD1102]
MPGASAGPSEPVEVFVDGELDIARVPRLGAVLDAIIDRRPARLVIDLADCRRVDAAGVSLLLDTHRRLMRSGGEVTLRHPSTRVRRILRITRLLNVLRTEPAEPPAEPPGQAAVAADPSGVAAVPADPSGVAAVPADPSGVAAVPADERSTVVTPSRPDRDSGRVPADPDHCASPPPGERVAGPVSVRTGPAARGDLGPGTRPAGARGPDPDQGGAGRVGPEPAGARRRT